MGWGENQTELSPLKEPQEVSTSLEGQEGLHLMIGMLREVKVRIRGASAWGRSAKAEDHRVTQSEGFGSRGTLEFIWFHLSAMAGTPLTAPGCSKPVGHSRDPGQPQLLWESLPGPAHPWSGAFMATNPAAAAVINCGLGLFFLNRMN